MSPYADINIQGLSDQEQASSVKLGMEQSQRLLKMEALLWDLAESASSKLFIQVIQERKSVPLLWYDSSPGMRPGFRYAPLSKETPLLLSPFFTALFTQSSFLSRVVGISEEQFRWLTAQISIIYFRELKKSVTRLRENRTTRDDKLQMLLDFTCLATITAQDLAPWISCINFDMCNHLRAYSQHFISKLEIGLPDIETRYITSWTLLLRGIFCLDSTGRDHDSLGVKGHELLRLQCFRTVQAPCGVQISGVPYGMKLSWEE